MKLFNTSDQKEYVIAILLRHDEGEGYLLEVSRGGQSVLITDQRAFKYTNGWENLTYDIDELLFYVENDHKIELKKAVFFIYSHLIDLKTREIAPTYRDILAKIIKDNDLEALGYLEMDQVILKYLEQKEQQSLSAVILEIDTPAVSLFMYQAGTLVFSESVARTENIVADLSEILQHTSKDTILPSRLIMYDAGGLKEEASKILEHKWPKETFIHVPKVEVLNEDDLKNGLVVSYKEQILAASGSGMAAVTTATAVTEAEIIEEPQEAIQETMQEMPSQEMTPQDLGFVMGTDVKKAHLPEPVSSSMPETPASYSAKSVSLLSKIRNNIKMPRFSLPRMPGKLMVAVFVATVLLLGMLGGALYYAHAATLTIFYDKADIKETVDFDKADFVEKKSEKIQTESSIKTTGTKKVGEKAKGTVTIFNATESDKAFKKGTKIIASNKLEFILNSDVTVKAATKTVTSGGDILTTTSKEKTDVTAVDLGSASNMGKDTKFTFESTPDTTYFAKSNDAFSGGTEKEIQTASKEDFNNLKSDVEKQINKKKADSLKQAADSHKIIDQLTEITIVKEDFSKEVAEEAKTLDAKVTAEVTYYMYDDQKVKEALVKKLEDKVPPNYALATDNVSFTIKSAEKNDADITISLDVTATPTYTIDSQKLLHLVKGKTTNSVEKIIKDNIDAKGFSIDVASPVPFLKLITPLFDKNYQIKTEPLE